MKFNHIGVFVESLEFGRLHLSSILEIKKWSEPIMDETQGVIVQFGYCSSNICYELIAPNADINPVSKVLKDGKGILNHIAYKVDNIDKTIRHLESLNSILISGPVEAKAFSNKKIAFLFTPLRFIVELIED